ncbi:cytochrome P450 [Zychaea mexicana]|uniref:cytochrome P450 n=1 Tax=Zychaea mexicana TaxID=64656 RepID=UPI0022FDC9C9|nr:cytochrome P450 [Zychaea mexicana]KAI9492551.1 cytochrome P450 [Zychaea mexicana]
MMLSLCCHHEAQHKLREEVDQFIAENERLPTMQLPHLISATKECMRYRPIASPFGILHETTEDLLCRGYFIPKGTSIAYNMRAMHESPDVYDDPDKFIPNRFLNRLKPMSALANGPIHERDHYNFGWGRRTCPGIHLINDCIAYV